MSGLKSIGMNGSIELSWTKRRMVYGVMSVGLLKLKAKFRETHSVRQFAHDRNVSSKWEICVF